jgi:hypothetical protein
MAMARAKTAIKKATAFLYSGLLWSACIHFTGNTRRNLAFDR